MTCAFVTCALLFFVINTGFTKRVILTFDDGPHPYTTEKILEILNQQEITATFFLVGIMIEKYPHLVKKIYESGCEIGNHTYSDTRLTTLNKMELKDSLNSVNKLLESITGKQTIFFRPPGGRSNKDIIETARKEGYYTVFWTRHVSDTSYGITVEKIIKRATVNPLDTELIMMHDGPPETIEALPEVIRFYKKRGYEFTTVSKVTPPMFKNMNGGAGEVSDWPMVLGNANSGEMDWQLYLIGIIALFASIGSTFYFIRYSNSRKMNIHVSIVFLGVGKKYLQDLFKILRDMNIIGTFFLSEKDVGELLDLNNPQIHYHNIAYLKSSVPGEVKESLIRWKRKLHNSKYSIIPLYYSISGYTKKEIKELKEEGFFPVNWKMAPPDRELNSSHHLIEYVMKKLKNRTVIPIWGDRKLTVEALPDLINEISLKGYSILSLNDYLVKRYN